MAGATGTYVISWSQTETDGVQAAPSQMLTPGAVWRWLGEALRIDGPSDLLRLEGALGADELRARAARAVRRILGPAVADPPARPDHAPEPAQGFSVTDGRQVWVLTLLTMAETGAMLLAGNGAPPPAGRDLWLAEVVLERRRLAAQGGKPGTICFTPGTLIATPQGPRRVETLRPGDEILTRDSGARPVLWIGRRKMSGARLHAMPELRPIRVKAEALGAGQPQPDLLISPQHRLLVRGAAARALFNSDEVLVEAGHLVNDLTIRRDRSLREVTYIHLLLDSHHVIWANGLPTESFHPADSALEMLEPDQQAGLEAVFPGLVANPSAYGPAARRVLSGSEAAIFAHDLRRGMSGSH